MREIYFFVVVGEEWDIVRKVILWCLRERLWRLVKVCWVILGEVRYVLFCERGGMNGEFIGIIDVVEKDNDCFVVFI